ncbi:MAG: hypothetical protein PHE17_14990 [Thiothrix sp.]|uniref:hypothetical protein n=1 Tax=Thiothrix sp. TaxID=1032 RepID=UPI002614AD8C|nr:hypothetical protein [Thiothrix sp.]MDD5394318.1 hypothetical protein [Thiothrix sp.]
MTIIARLADCLTPPILVGGYGCKMTHVQYDVSICSTVDGAALDDFLRSWLESGDEYDHVIKGQFLLTELVALDNYSITSIGGEIQEGYKIEEKHKPLFDKMKEDFRNMLKKLERIEYIE